MKKLLLISLFIPFISCSSGDKSSLSLDSSSESMHFEDTYQIKANSDNSISYKSENEFHAKVSSSGLITAGRVGETSIIVSDGSETKNIKVTITPVNTLYEEPYTDWTLTKSQILAKLGTAYSSPTDGLIYQTSNAKAPFCGYTFDANGNITSSSVLINTAYTSEASIFLKERYFPVSTSNNVIYMINNLTISQSTTTVTISVYNLSYLLVAYFPYTSTKSSLLQNNYSISENLYQGFLHK